MESASVVGIFDVAQITLYAFWAFFAGLIWYLRTEDRREGYPLESDLDGSYDKAPWLFVPKPKTFRLMHDRGTKQVPDFQRDSAPENVQRLDASPGSPLVPTGNPMTDGVGPAAWSERLDVVDLTADGDQRIVPLRTATEFHVVEEDPDPRGMAVVGADGEVAGEVTDVWVDRADSLIRYLEVDCDGKSVMLPMPFCVLKGGVGRKWVYVDAITAAQFADVPMPAAPGKVTRREEDKIAAYYGGGTLYATPERQEPLI